MKQVRWAVVILALAVLAGMVGWWAADRYHQKAALQGTEDSLAKIRFQSALEGLAVDDETVNGNVFEVGLRELAYTEGQPLVVFGQREKVTPGQIAVEYRPISELTDTTNKVGVVTSAGRAVVAFDSMVQDNDITYLIYLDPSLWNEGGEAKARETASYQFWRLMGLVTGIQMSPETPVSAWRDELKYRLFEVPREQGWRLVPQAYAICNGQYTCGLLERSCTCIDYPSYACETDGVDCGPGYVSECDCTDTCDWNAGCADCGPGACTGGEWACTNPRTCYGGTVECTNTCAWATPPPANSPTPGPSPTNGPSPTGQSCAQSNCGSTCSNNSTCYGGTTCQWQGANGFICWDNGACCASGGFQSGCGDYCNEGTGNFCFGSGFSCKPKADIPNGGCSHNNCCWRDSCTVQPTPTPIAATISGDLFCQHGGVYPNRYSQVSDFYAWVGDGNGRLNQTLVSTNYTGDGKGTYTISNWYPPGYPSNSAFYVRSGFALDQINAGIWGSNGVVG